MQNILMIRKANKKDIHLIYELINGLALYEKRPEDMTGSIEALNFWLFEKNVATAIIAEINNRPIGYAIYYPIFASFSTRANAHLEDIFIKPEYRHQGFGREFLYKLFDVIKSEGYSKVEWNCLDWNNSSIEFYKKIGAQQETGRVYFEYSLE